MTAKCKVLAYPAQNPDLNPIENLRAYLKKKVRERHPLNLEELEAIAKEE